MALTVALATPLLAACGAPATVRQNAPTRPPAATRPTPVTLVRTGGDVRLRDRVVVSGDGRWTSTDRAGARRTGRLSDARLRQLRSLASGRATLAAEARRPSTPANCLDAPDYAVTVGSTTVRFTGCPDDPARPYTAAAIADLIDRAVLR